VKQKLVYLLKHNAFLQGVYRHTMSFVFRTLGLLVPVDPELALFVSFMGTKYNDSPRAISEYLARDERYAHLRRVWALEKPEDYFTDPDTAADFVCRTGIDSLAVAVGNAHGDYKFPPKLDFDRIETIAGKTGLPLVLHGGSGLSDSDFRTAVQRGICKVNIFTDIDKAGKAGIEKGLAAGASSMMGLIPYEIEAMKKVVRNKMELFGSVGRFA
jgi:hypothetical protein